MKMKVKVKSLSRVQLFATPWTAAYQAPLPMGFSRQEHCYSFLCLLISSVSDFCPADDMILYIENPKDSTRKLLELINDYTKVAGYKINTHKSLAFLCTNNEKIEREIKETIPFTITTKIIKYLRLYLPKETKDIYIENYETQVKEIKRTLIDGKIYCVHGKK